MATGPRRSSPDDRAALVERLTNAGRRTSDAAVMFHTALSQHLGIGVSDWKILGLLDQHGPLSAGELSRHSGLAPASITGAIDRLVKRGYVKRLKAEGDARRVLVALDQPLLDGVETQFAVYFRRLATLLERYDDDQVALIAEFLDVNATLMSEATAEISENH